MHSMSNTVGGPVETSRVVRKTAPRRSGNNFFHILSYPFGAAAGELQIMRTNSAYRRFLRIFKAAIVQFAVVPVPNKLSVDALVTHTYRP